MRQMMRNKNDKKWTWKRREARQRWETRDEYTRNVFKTRQLFSWRIGGGQAQR